jgi:hypothetical protein
MEVLCDSLNFIEQKGQQKKIKWICVTPQYPFVSMTV